jgi:C_GCAxxG_C_C family probable redox protein
MKRKPTPIDYPQKAADYFKNGYNCAQSVLLTMQEYYGNPQNELIPKIAAAFGAGIGRCGSLCGALTGATMTIGIRHAPNEPGMEKR